ncbi:MAG: hypothetical protein ACR2KO_07005 [Geodermatophilaceae bacterium]|jgi:hypothetical protein|nr:hypothetical protein [Geodermatophilaceae bacterium]
MPSSGGGVGETVLLCVLVAIVILVPLFGPRLWRATGRLVEDRRDRRAQRNRVSPQTGQLVDDLRRLSRKLAELPHGAPWARQHGTQMAYDDVLVALCRALDVEHDLATLPMGMTRDLERLRVEDALYAMGLRIHTVGT